MLASFHLVRYRARSLIPAQGRALGLDRRAVGRVEGLRFWRSLVLGIGPPERPRGLPVPAPRCSAFLAVWDDEAALDDFLETSPVSQRWEAHAKERWHVRLEPVHTHGTWGGTNPFAGGGSKPVEGPGAVLTFINLRAKGFLPFWQTMPVVSNQLVGQPGFLVGVGLTDAPPGTLRRNVTFSLWRSLDDAMDFAYRQPQHDDAVRRSRDKKWDLETCFARFRPYGSVGTWNGRDPLSADRSADDVYQDE
ncbi:MAG: spheroidene monooxygenase [Egibacteraceae bacterium]